MFRELVEDLRDFLRAKTDQTRALSKRIDQLYEIALRLFYDYIQQPMVAPPSPSLPVTYKPITEAIGIPVGPLLKDDKVELKFVFDSAAAAPDPDQDDDEQELEDLEPITVVDERIWQLREKVEGLRVEINQASETCSDPECACAQGRTARQEEWKRTWREIERLEASRSSAAVAPASAPAPRCVSNDELQLVKLRAMKTMVQAKLATGGCVDPACWVCPVIRTTLRANLEAVDRVIARLEISGGGPAIAG